MPPTDATLEAPVADAPATVSDGEAAVISGVGDGPEATTEPSPASPGDGSQGAFAPVQLVQPTPPNPLEKPARPANAPKREPSLQQTAIGWEDVDLAIMNFFIRRQTGTPSVTTETVQVVKKTKEMVKDEATGEEKEVVKETTVPEDRKKVDYAWQSLDDAERIGDDYPSLTSALRAQAEMAKAEKKDGFEVKEYIKAEYGVWYVTDPEGVKPGHRYSVMYTPAPIRPVKEKVVREPKAPKEPKDPNAPKKPRGKKNEAAAATAPAAEKSEAVDADDILGDE